jgi:hypothetical protein
MKFLKLFEQSIDFSNLLSNELISTFPLYVIIENKTEKIGDIHINRYGYLSNDSKEVIYNTLFFYLIRLVPEIDINDIKIYYYYETFQEDESKEFSLNKSESLLNFLNNDPKIKTWWFRLISNSKVSSVDLAIQNGEEFENSKERIVIIINNAKTDYSSL